MKAATLFLIAAAPALAEFQLFTVAGTSETPVAAAYDLGAAPASETLSVRFRLRNTGSAADTLRMVTISGAGFTLSGHPMSAQIVAPGMNVDFTVRFSGVNAGPHTANLSINGRVTMLTATAQGSIIVTLDGQLLPSGSTIEFGIVERGQSVARTVRVENRTSSVLSLDSVTASGNGFSATAPPTPALIQPEASLSIDVICKPEKSGFTSGSLTINGRQYSLAALVSEPKAPRPAITISGTVRSAEQIAVEVPLAEASRANVNGTLTVETQGGTRDDAVLFAASGRRTTTFEVREGDRKAKFGTSERTVLQTGTSAGTLLLRVELGGYSEQLTIVVAPEAPRADSGTAAREGRNLVVNLSGFDNTRTLSRLGYTFYDAKGSVINAAPIVPDVAAEFRRYFESSTLGGTFAVKAVFPVTGDPAQISAVEVEMKNDSGTSRTGRLRF